MSEQVLKIIVVGDPAVGKTSIIRRYVHDMFSNHYRSTIGVDFAMKRVVVDGLPVRAQLWDVAGADRYGSMSRVYFKDAVGAVVVFDASSPDTRAHVADWKQEIDEKVELRTGDPLPCLLIANKCDLVDSPPDEAEMEELCQTLGFAAWRATSAKTGANVAEAAESIVAAIVRQPGLLDGSVVTEDAMREAAARGEATRLDAGSFEVDGKRSGCC